MGRTELLFKPSMQECVKAAVDHKMPEAEGRKFYYHYESNGWRVGKLPMQSFAGAMGGWFERWLERTGGNAPATPATNGQNHSPTPMSGALLMLKQKEYERILARIRVLRDSYDSHAEMRVSDRGEFQKLVKRKKELQKDLGITI